MTALDMPDVGPAFMAWVFVAVLGAFLLALLWNGGGYK